MCGHHVGVRQKAHIMAEEKKTEINVLMLFPTCHIMFDTHLKPKVFKAMIEAGLRGFPESWKKSVYEQAAEASAKALKRDEGLIANSNAGREKREQLRQDALAAWADYQTTGLHVTAEEADDWLAKLEAGKSAVIPECHL
jgi:predicted transcriptional regulator